jgi:hypothetical protein
MWRVKFSIGLCLRMSLFTDSGRRAAQSSMYALVHLPFTQPSGLHEVSIVSRSKIVKPPIVSSEWQILLTLFVRCVRFPTKPRSALLGTEFLIASHQRGQQGEHSWPQYAHASICRRFRLLRIEPRDLVSRKPEAPSTILMLHT